MASEEKQKRRVLIVEDDPFMLDILSFKFSSAGWEVLSALDGEAGIEKMQAQKPDILMLDILLPGIDGYGVMEKMQADETLKTIPVLVLSNYSEEKEIERSFTLGAADHLVKANVIVDEVPTKAAQVVAGTYKRQ